ncbi:hypothetical protein DFH08DRAFT_724739 [Mycena albidolilacea]|uniref:Uncharacterized protein n=1 Tax=Mycena albidolilacea TaxID=1033008 RepID=A0AAD6YX64_9AGAR|nr:hypothetical protein DFH08DRAFT_724739 [Mycena albidolilacea]
MRLTLNTEECLVDFVEMHGEHSGENMANLVWDSLERLGIAPRVVSFVMDNATNNDTLVEHFAVKCQARGVLFSEENGRMRCLPLVIHLAALEVRSCEFLAYSF